MLTPTNEVPKTVPTTSEKRRTGQLPSGDIALSALVTKAAETWQSSALPGLLWLSKDELTALAATYAQGRDAADAVGDQRTPQARRLQELDKLLAKGLKYVKGYLAEVYDEDEGRAYYGEFGIEREGKNYLLPSARPERVKSLEKLLLALPKHGFDQKKYGTAYWQPLATEYAALVKATTDTTGQLSGKVSVKDEGVRQVRKALRALIHHIKANFPDTSAAELRRFGFQKESYG